MKVLVTAASHHGATIEVADAIARRLTNDGFEVVRKSPEEVDSLDGFDAVVCGSAVYMTQWLPEAHDFMERFAQQLHKLPVWAFSVGMRIGPVLTRVDAKELRSFAGRYDPSILSLRERAIVRLAGAVEGDFRDWIAIDQWADSIAQQLKQD